MTKTLIKRPIRSNRLPTWEPLGDFDNMLAGFFRPLNEMSPTAGSWAPAVDIRETEEAFLVEAELPGMTKDNVEVTFEDGMLTLSGERKLEEETEEKDYRRIERRYGSFTRSFTLPREVDAEAVKARFKDGLLTIEVPKKETVKPRTIEVH